MDGAAFARMIVSASAAIEQKKQKINELNVFPVPDGDTGTNMSMTLAAAAQDLKKRSPESLTKAADMTASALLRGARGNSGVILSLLFRGFSKSLKGKLEANGKDFAEALSAGVEAAYKAVMKPAEGTILTVSRLTGDAARDLAADDANLESVLMGSIETAKVALENTVNQNPVLKKAGVVDAGGMGFVTILEGMLASLQGNDVALQENAGETKEQADLPTLQLRILRSPTIRSISSARRTRPSISSRCVYTSTPSATALSSARTTRRSRSTSTRTFPGKRLPSPRNTARWSWQRSKTCACSTTIWQKGARRARPTI